MDRFYYVTSRGGFYEDGVFYEGATPQCFFVFDHKRGSDYVMAECDDRDDAERIVKALNESVA